jgi:hypothetical protein
MAVTRRDVLTLLQVAVACCLVLLAGFSFSGGTLGVAAEPPEATGRGDRLVLIIRHAEKTGDPADVHLSARGVERARRLPEMFVKSARRPVPFPTPDFIFAAGNTSESHRPVETVTPLAARLRLPIRSKYQDQATSDGCRGMWDLSDEIRHNPLYAGKTVLICWHYHSLPQLARALNAADAPDSWDKSVFDSVWQIRYDAAGRAEFSDLSQALLPGDLGR